MRARRHLNSDFLIAGGGIVGSTIARKLAIKYPSCSIRLIEKDSVLGRHNSIMNSGVLHSGLYYPTNSNRAIYCVRGNKLLTNYHEDKKLPLIKCGKLIVPSNKEEAERVKGLYERGLNNGVRLELINSDQALKIEPYVKVREDFPVLYSPDTSVGHPSKVMEELEKDLKSMANVKINTNCGFKGLISRSEKEIIIQTTNEDLLACGKLINAAGLYSDNIARAFGVGLNYQLFPIIGTYLVDTSQNAPKLKVLVYPLPPAKKGNNFLGVHTTITANGSVKLGPSALPCLWREQHLGLGSIKFTETIDITKLAFKMLLSKNNLYFLNLFLSQLKNQISSNIIEDSKKLVTIYDDLQKNILGLNKVSDRFKFKLGGVRSQLVNVNNWELENDFIILKEGNHVHLLNMISPGWTSAFAIAEDIF